MRRAGRYHEEVTDEDRQDAGAPAKNAPRFLVVAAICVASACARDAAHGGALSSRRVIPTRKAPVVTDYHGTKVSDPYQWLEDSESAEVRAWTEEQNADTERVLASIPGRDALRAKIRALLSIGFVAAPAVRTLAAGRRRYFHEKREGAQNQPILYVRDGLDGGDRILLDPAPLSADGTTAVDWWSPSNDGGLVAWGRSESGSEDSTLYVRDVATGQDLADRIPDTRHASVAWLPDAKSFYYSRYPARGTVPEGDEKYFSRIFHHVLGADPKDDRLVFGEGRDKIDVPSVDISPGGRWLVVRVHRGWDKSDVYVRDLARGDGAPWTAIAEGRDALFEPMPHDDRLYVLTNDGAPRYRLFEVDYARPSRDAWKEILPEQPDVLGHVAIVRGEIVAAYMHEARTRLERFAKDGRTLGPIALPTIGTASVTGAWDDDDVFIQFTSHVTPYQVLRFERATAERGTTSVWDRVGASFVPDAVKVEVMYATSKDGTRVPMFVVSKEGTKRDGTAPAILWGYGGFNINQTPAFSARTLLTVERGGVWATAVLRGGGEFGEAWHRAGMLERKQNVFDDFIACAEALVASKITSPARLGIIGGSNGGLLTAAAVTQRPDLFRVALSLVPLTDMLRYHKFRIGQLWIPEYGSADVPEQFDFLYAYSPYHRVHDGTRYPAMLFATAESDSRVDPMHARKMAARMQAAQPVGAADRPILLKVESKAGHGAGKPLTKLVDQLTDELSFLFGQLGM